MRGSDNKDYSFSLEQIQYISYKKLNVKNTKEIVARIVKWYIFMPSNILNIHENYCLFIIYNSKFGYNDEILKIIYL